jgi:hypothetical protein
VGIDPVPIAVALPPTSTTEAAPMHRIFDARILAVGVILAIVLAVHGVDPARSVDPVATGSIGSTPRPATAE